ncbi:MAG TPA: site-2 protease family protein [Bacillota bacterium]|nr:site-2 protease family protein [Bacillota bacterium]
MLALAAAGGLGREVVLLVVALLVHEGAHLVAAAAFGLEVEQVEILPFGGVARIPGLSAAEPAVESAVAMAGPLGSLLVFGATTWARDNAWLDPHLGAYYQAINLALGVSNLLPALPLDGGRVARALLAGRMGYGRATLAVVRAGYLCAVLLLVSGAVLWAAGTFAPSAFVFALFAWDGARRERWLPDLRTWRDLLGRGRAVFARGGALPVRPLAVRDDAPLQSLLRSVAPGRYHLLWILAADGRVLGTADEAALMAALLRYGPLAPARRLLEPE